MTVSGRPEGERLLRIGPFSRQARLSPHQLRHYHELGLLLPAIVDPESGYRYYAASQTATAEVIAVLRSVDMPLAEIRDLLRDPGRERVQAALDRHRTRLEGRLQEAGHMLGRLRELMQEGISMNAESVASDLIEVVLDSVRMKTDTGQHALLLRERDADRVLVLWVGPTEANAAAMRLHDERAARPLTHDLLATLVERARATVDRVVVTHRDQDVYYATVHLRWAGGAEEIDARPSDAINLAVRTGAPILVAAPVMEQAARREQGGERRWPTVVAEAVEAGTGHDLGLVHLLERPGPGDQVVVNAPTAWCVVSVEPAEGGATPRIVVRRPTPE